MAEATPPTYPLHARLGRNTNDMLTSLIVLLEESKTSLITRLIREEYDRQSHRFAMRALGSFAEQGVAVDPSKVMTSTGPLAVDNPRPGENDWVDPSAAEFFGPRA